jgi:hypothetical protein
VITPSTTPINAVELADDARQDLRDAVLDRLLHEPGY